MSQAGSPTGKKGIYRRNNTLYARIVIPADLREHYPTSEVWQTLQTNDIQIAQYRAAAIFHKMKTEFANHRGEHSLVKDALKWKQLLAEGEKSDGQKLAEYRKQNPHTALMASVVEDLNLAEHSTSFGYHLEHVRETQGDDVAGTLADIAFGRSLPTLTYIEDWKAAQKVIPRTLVMAETRLKTMEERFPTLPVKKTAVARWIIELEQSGKAEETIKGLIGSCRSYYAFLQRVGHLNEDGQNPFENHKYTKKKKANRMEIRQPWEVEDLVKLAQAAKQKGSDKNLFALIVLGAYTGARIEELARLETVDVKIKEGVHCFEIKAAKSGASLRDIPIHQEIMPFVQSLIEESKDGYLLQGEPVTSLGERSSAIGKRFGRLKSQLGYDDRYVFHSVRKTVATLFERASVPLNDAAEIIGHEKVGMTYGVYSGGITMALKIEHLHKISYPEIAKLL